MSKQNKGSGAKKYDRNRDWCKGYLAAGVQARNQLRRVSRHARGSIKHMHKVNAVGKRTIGYDKQAVSWLKTNGKEIRI